MSNGFDHLKLCRADAEMLDRLVDVGFELDQLEYLSPEEEQRASRILKMIGILDAYPVEDATDTLIDATLARIDQYELQRSARMQIHAPELRTTKTGFRLRMPDFVTVAAMILITVSVFTMINSRAQNQSMTNQCASNMAMMGRGLVNYALDNNGETPTEKATAVASLFGGLVPERTDAKILAEQGYCEHSHLNCPGHVSESGGFSFQTQPAAMWDAIQNQGRVLVLISDQNPILEKLLANKSFNKLKPSPAHGLLGQNHLCDDGSITSVPAPIFKGDFIWILEAQNRGMDIFLTH
jgi:hypothetical protein